MAIQSPDVQPYCNETDGQRYWLTVVQPVNPTGCWLLGRWCALAMPLLWGGTVYRQLCWYSKWNFNDLTCFGRLSTSFNISQLLCFEEMVAGVDCPKDAVVPDTRVCKFDNEPVMPYYWDPWCRMGMLGCNADSLLDGQKMTKTMWSDHWQ